MCNGWTNFLSRNAMNESGNIPACPIFLVGYMGSGKTTLGRMLAARTGRTFVDADELLEAAEGMTCAEIMKQKGETYFRLAERKTLRHIVQDYPTAIVGAGGGMPCFHNNMQTMNRHGMTIYLKWAVEDLASRLEQTDIATRPMLRGKSSHELRGHIARQLSEREPFYSQATKTLDCDNQNDYVLLDKLMQLLDEKE